MGSTVSLMRPDTPAENVDHTAEAARLERTAGLYPEDAEALLLKPRPTWNWPATAPPRPRSTTACSPPRTAWRTPIWYEP